MPTATLNFYALIIGTEILNRRRTDAHFNFVSKALADKGHTLTGSFIIEDDPALIVKTIQFIASQPHVILFSFGGIGSTPDDYTRKCAASALCDGKMVVHEEAKSIIEEKLGENAYPHPIKMANLPQGASLLYNPVNQMPAFSLDEQFYFMPGFPEMSHPMVTDVLSILIPNKQKIYRQTLTAKCKENIFIDIMQQMPQELEYSSLPKLINNAWQVSISVSSDNQILTQEAFDKYTELLKEKNIPYTLTDEA